MRVRRRGEPIEQPLVRVAQEHELKVVSLLACQGQEASTHRCADVFGRCLHEASASR